MTRWGVGLCGVVLLVLSVAAAEGEKRDPVACLQYVVVEDMPNSMFLADRYETSCEDSPDAVYHWAPYDRAVPQICDACEAARKNAQVVGTKGSDNKGAGASNGVDRDKPIVTGVKDDKSFKPLNAGEDFKDKMPEKAKHGPGPNDKWKPRTGASLPLSKCVYVKPATGSRIFVKLFAAELDFRKAKGMPKEKWQGKVVPVRTMRVGYELSEEAIGTQVFDPALHNPKKIDGQSSKFIGTIEIEGSVFVVMTNTALFK